MSITLEEARQIIADMVDSPALRTHMRSVEIVMRALAEKAGEDVEQWGITGLLHDADYCRYPDEHPNRIVAMLRDRGEEAIAHAISAHYTQWGVSYDSQLDKALLAADELTGFIIAVARVRPNKLADLTPKSVKKKLKDKSFAAGVERAEVHAGVELLGVDLTDHIQFIIDALRPYEAELF
ncbi:MAG: HD domain-containing protein [Planctomycetota bacterium]